MYDAGLGPRRVTGVDVKASRIMWGWEQGDSRKGKIAKQEHAGPRQALWTEKPGDGQAEPMGFLEEPYAVLEL
jgi:hypothetical protein